jgi:antitoxin (DNA-binding transcriptional repressor) of toxin-antitoxin stability system
LTNRKSVSTGQSACITGDTVKEMKKVTMRELRNEGGAVIDRLGPGETVMVTRDGAPFAELRRVGREPLTAEELIAHWKHLPDIDYAAMRAELDEIIDPWL